MDKHHLKKTIICIISFVMVSIVSALGIIYGFSLYEASVPLLFWLFIFLNPRKLHDGEDDK